MYHCEIFSFNNWISNHLKNPRGYRSQHQRAICFPASAARRGPYPRKREANNVYKLINIDVRFCIFKSLSNAPPVTNRSFSKPAFVLSNRASFTLIFIQAYETHQWVFEKWQQHKSSKLWKNVIDHESSGMKYRIIKIWDFIIRRLFLMVRKKYNESLLLYSS